MDMTDLVKRLRIKAGMIELGELIAWGSDSALMREAADVLEMAAPAVQGEPVAHTFYILHDATEGQKYIKKDVDDGCLQIFEREEDAQRAKRRHPGTEYTRVDYYTAPQPPEQQATISDEIPTRTTFGGPQRFTTAEQQPTPDVVELDPKDLIVQLWSSKPKSGWDYALACGVKITHVPSGITVTCDTERSTHANKNKALGDLQSQLAVNPAPDVSALAEALESIMRYIPLGVVYCRGDKCRELWCASCFGDEEAESYLATIERHLKNAESALAAFAAYRKQGGEK